MKLGKTHFIVQCTLHYSTKLYNQHYYRCSQVHNKEEIVSKLICSAESEVVKQSKHDHWNLPFVSKEGLTAIIMDKQHTWSASEMESFTTFDQSPPYDIFYLTRQLIGCHFGHWHSFSAFTEAAHTYVCPLQISGFGYFSHTRC